MLLPVRDFMRNQTGEIKKELNNIIWCLEHTGTLEMPYGEKVDKELFVIRVIRAGNIRIFYIYGKSDIIWGIHAYVKKTVKIPNSELREARRIVKLLMKEGALE